MDSDLAKVLTVLIPALGGFGAAWLANLKDRRDWKAKQEANEQASFDIRWEKLSASAREMIDRLQKEVIEAKAQVAVLTRDLELAQRECAEVRRELEALRERRRKPRADDTALKR